MNKLLKNMMLNLLTKPLPDNVCWIFKQPPCVVCWTCVGIVVFLVTTAILLTGVI